MQFNSLLFLIVFLPLALALNGAAVGAPHRRVQVLLAVSFLFYACFDLRFVPLLAFSIIVNWTASQVFVRQGLAAAVPLTICANLFLLIAFKYLDFLSNLAVSFGLDDVPTFELALPVGISFFTFQQIGYLVDVRRGQSAPLGLCDYALAIAFFPKIIAGPLVRPADFVNQLCGPPAGAEPMARGLLLLLFGLAKKVGLGDPLGSLVNPIYTAVVAGQAPTVADAWIAMLGYTFQLYFDFSGYTDMALGIALMLGIVLPQNFDVPYRATSIQDFWRRWHMTLSSFLRDYLYVPFGGNRHGLSRQLLALFATMAIGGLWHGAGLTFLAWGSAHGAALGLQLLWRRTGLALPAPAGVVATFAFVNLAWVLFRAPSFDAALVIYAGLAGIGTLGVGGGSWGLIAIAAAFACLGPTAETLVHRIPPRAWVAVGGAAITTAILLKVGDDANLDFIYAQF